MQILDPIGLLQLQNMLLYGELINSLKKFGVNMKRFQMSAFVALVFLLGSLNTQAATYNFKYTFSDASALEGTFDGTLQTGGDVVNINSFSAVQYAGVVFPIITDSSFTTSPFSSNGMPRVSFSGQVLDVFACSGGFDNDGVCNVDEPFFILDADASLIFVSTNTVNPPPDFYDASNWRLSEVPAPAAVWLFGSALLGFAGLRRQNNT